MNKRAPYENEVDALESVDGKTVYSIRTRGDGLYEFYVERRSFDDEETTLYWTQDMLPRPHIFASIEDARAEILAQFGDLIGPNR
ncbi:MAG: hypothetical protein AAFR03_02865 [Pseudomonadota bacterium]